jgi:hypothetical protein
LRLGLVFIFIIGNIAFYSSSGDVIRDKPDQYKKPAKVHAATDDEEPISLKSVSVFNFHSIELHQVSHPDQISTDDANHFYPVIVEVPHLHEVK